MKKLIIVFVLMAFWTGAALGADVNLMFNWDHPNPPNIDKWQIYYSTTPGADFVEFGEAIPNKPLIVMEASKVLTAQNGETFYFVATAFRGLQESKYSNQVSYTVDVPGPIPAPPNNFSINVTIQVNVTGQ